MIKCREKDETGEGDKRDRIQRGILSMSLRPQVSLLDFPAYKTRKVRPQNPRAWECEAWPDMSLTHSYESNSVLPCRMAPSVDQRVLLKFFGWIVTKYFFLCNVLWCQIHRTEIISILNDTMLISSSISYSIIFCFSVPSLYITTSPSIGMDPCVYPIESCWLSWFSIAALTNYYKQRSFKQHRLCISWFL